MKTFLTALCLATLLTVMIPMHLQAETTVEMTGVQARACAVAMQQCLKDQPKADLSKFSVSIVSAEGGLEVVIVPPQSVGKPAVRGGATDAGIEMHYLVETAGFTIVQRKLGR